MISRFVVFPSRKKAETDLGVVFVKIKCEELLLPVRNFFESRYGYSVFKSNFYSLDTAVFYKGAEGNLIVTPDGTAEFIRPKTED